MVRPSNPVRGESQGTKDMGKSRNTGVASLDVTWEFPLSSFRLRSARKIGLPPRHWPRGTGDAAGCRPSPAHPPVRHGWSPPPRIHLGRWRRLWGPEQSRSSLPRSLRLTLEPSEWTGRPSWRRRAWAGESNTSWHSWRQGWIWSPDWSGWYWSGSTRTEWCISCTRYYPSGSTSIKSADFYSSDWVNCLPRAPPWWWRSLTRPSRPGAPFAPLHK